MHLLCTCTRWCVVLRDMHLVLKLHKPLKANLILITSEVHKSTFRYRSHACDLYFIVNIEFPLDLRTTFCKVDMQKTDTVLGRAI